MQNQKNEETVEADNPGTGGDLDADKDYIILVELHRKEHGSSKAMAMKAITAKYPEKHAEWLRSVQTA